jgi:glycosyltransferase involved in cell wall biosynthesis
MIYADQRWIGDHGIGRFARNVLAGIDYCPVSTGGHPAAPLDAYRLARALGVLSGNDLFFSPGYNTPLFCSRPFVFTIHDLSHIYCPQNSSASIRLYYAMIMKPACYRAAKILTVSEFTRKQILEWSGVSPERVCNVSCGVDPKYCAEGTVYQASFPYLLSVSNRKPHKNELRIVMAFAQSRLAPEIHLMFTGDCTRELTALIAQHRLAATVHFTGRVPEEDLPALYRGATALVFPSLYEGFGLPVLEAMACGTPVVTSKVTAMPEVAGDGALLVDPTSVAEISEAMRRIVSDASLRRRLPEKGLLRAAQFSWEKTTAAVRSILAEGSLGKCLSANQDPK